MKMRKLLAWLLILCMAVTAFMFVGCNVDDGPEGDDDDEIAEEDLSPTFDGDYKKYKGSFNVLTVGDGAETASFNIVDLVADNNLGDAAIVKAVRERNQLIEENFGIKIKRSKVGINGTQGRADLAAECNTAVQSESNTYDAFIQDIAMQIDLACQGGMLDLYQAPYMDITAKWWNKGVVDSMLLAGGAYFIVGDLQTVDKDATYCTLFNEKLLEDYNKGLDAGVLYDEVKKGIGKPGGFTMEKLNRWAAEHATPDTNGANMTDPSYDGIGNYGLYTQSEMTRVVIQAGGYLPTRINLKNVSGLESNINAEFEQAVAQAKVVFGDVSKETWFNNLDTAASASGAGGEFWDKWARGSFKADRATFFMCHIGTIDNCRNMTSDFGVLPIAKLFDSQVDYGNTVQYYNCRSYSVMNRGEVLNEKSSYILEAMAYYSSREYANETSLEYNYYYRVLRAKGVRDERAWEMLDLIFDTRTYDLVYAASIGGVNSGIQVATTSPTGQFVNSYGQLDSFIRDKLKNLIAST
jgi:hypothetical protein